jgi:uncharacterized lipoprotein YmbA
MRRSLLLLCLLSACTRSSDPRLYTLVADESRATYPTSTTVEVRRPSIAGYLDRREIVRAVRSEQLDVAGDAIWAEPLDAMIGRVLAANLALRLPASRVITDLNSLGVVPDARIDIEVQRFEQGADGLVLRAMVAVRRGADTTPISLEAVELKDAGVGRDTEATVAAMNELLGQLADRIARTLATAPLAAAPSQPAK